MAAPAFDIDEAAAIVEPMARGIWRHWRFRHGVWDLDDLRQAGFLGILQARRSYGDHVRVQFRDYARRAARIRMAELIASGSILSGREILRCRGLVIATVLYDNIATKPVAAPSKQDVETNLARLSPLYRSTVSRRFGLDSPAYSRVEIAAMDGSSLAAVDRRISRSLQIMREADHHQLKD